jgi:large subunit ribosomal protein L6
MVSRLAKNPIEIPSGVEVSIANALISVKGKNGQLQQAIHDAVSITQNDKQLLVSPNNGARESNALAGTFHALVNNMVQGVSQGFERKLTMVGVGYRAKAQGKKLNVSAGFSHPVDVEMPEGVAVETPSQTEIVLKGADKQAVNQVAANLRAIRPPEPYKGKGIRYADERVILKEKKKK